MRGVLHGITPEELSEEPTAFLDAVHPEDRDRLRTAMDRLSNGQAGELEYRVNATEDYDRYVWIDARPVLDDEGDVTDIVGISRDVTERTEQQQELEQLQQRYQAYVENASDIITVLDADGTITYHSPSIERILGYTPDELIGENTFEYVHPDDRELALAGFEQLQSRPEQPAESVQFRLKHADGTWVWVEANGSAYTDTDPTKYVVTSRDVSERKRRERTLTALHGAAQEIGSATDPDAVYQAIVEAAAEILGFDFIVVDVEREGCLHQEYTHLDDADAGYGITSLEDDDTLAVRAYNRRETIVIDRVDDTDLMPSDSEYQSSLTVPIGPFGTFQAGSKAPEAFDRNDVELAEQLVDHATVKLEQLQDRQALEQRTEELRRQNDRLDEFVSVVSHDLRNPVTVAQGHVELLQASHDDERLDEIEHAADRMETLIDDLLTLARDGDRIDDLEPVNIESTVERCCRTVETSSVTVDIETDRTILADRERLRQLLENLVRNAVEHGTAPPAAGLPTSDTDEHGAGEPPSQLLDDGALTITIEELPDGLAVEDDGTGLPDDHDRIFDTGYSTAEEGTGLGLNIVNQIVTAHGWEITATEGADGGARFEITGVEFVDE